MSPSEARNTSSPLARKTRLGSPGLLAKPKNLRSMGGGAGGRFCAATGGCTTGVFTTRGIGASSCCRKILRPVPAYLVSSALFSRSNRKRGSRLWLTSGRFLEEELSRRGVVRVGGAEVLTVLYCGGAEALGPESTNTMRAT